MVNFASVFSCVGIMVLISNNLWSQVTGEWFFSEFPEADFFDIEIDENTLYGLIQSTHGFADTALYDYKTIVVEATLPSGSLELPVMEKYQRNSGGSASYGFRLTRVLDQWILVESTYGNSSNDTVHINVFDLEFNLIAHFSNPIYIGLASYCDEVLANGDVVGIGSVLDIPDSLLSIFYSSVDTSIIHTDVFRTTPAPAIAFVSSIAYDSIRHRFIVFHLGGISHLNDTLGLITRYPGYLIHTSQHGTVGVEGDSYFSFGATASQGSPDLRDLVFQKYDTTMQILFSEEFGRKGMDDYPFIKKSMEISNGNYFIGGMLAGPSDFTYKVPLKFFLAKYNEQLEQVWYREYGGSHSYVIRGVNVLDDDRILLYGSRVDNADGIRYPYLMLLNEDGEITSLQDIPVQEQDIVNVFYNAGSTDLNINAINPIDKFVLFTADGKLLLERYNLHAGTHSIETSRIPPGAYFYFASTSNRSQSGKWIKF